MKKVLCVFLLTLSSCSLLAAKERSLSSDCYSLAQACVSCNKSCSDCVAYMKCHGK